jgi:hypothetical protein
MPEELKEVKLGNSVYDVSHGTENRNLWRSIARNGKKRASYIEQMYGRIDPNIAAILDKILHVTESVESNNDRKTS